MRDPEPMVFVRIDDLVRRHPLQGEVARLDAMIARLDGPRPSASGLQPIGGRSVADPPAPRLVEERRLEARGRLEKAQRAGLSGIASGRAETAEAVLAARRVELEAEERRRLVEEERSLREDAESRIAGEVERVSGDLGLLRAAREGLEAQLREGFLIAVAPEVLDAQMVALAATTATIRMERGVRNVAVSFPEAGRGIGPRARLGAARLAVDRAAARIEADLVDFRIRVRRQTVERMTELRATSALSVDREIAILRDRRRLEVEPILERQDYEVLLERTLAMEEAPSRWIGDRPIPAFPSGEAWPGSVGRRNSGDRSRALRVTRDALVARIRALVEARVADAAQQRRFRIVYRQEPGVPDRTEAFAQWLGDSAEL